MRLDVLPCPALPLALPSLLPSARPSARQQGLPLRRYPVTATPGGEVVQPRPWRGRFQERLRGRFNAASPRPSRPQAKPAPGDGRAADASHRTHTHTQRPACPQHRHWTRRPDSGSRPDPPGGWARAASPPAASRRGRLLPSTHSRSRHRRYGRRFRRPACRCGCSRRGVGSRQGGARVEWFWLGLGRPHSP